MEHGGALTGRGLWVRGLVGGGRSPWVYARLSDGELLGLVSGRRDEAAFAEFFGRKARPVYSLILRRCRMRWRWRSWRAFGCIRRWNGCRVVSARSSSGRIPRPVAERDRGRSGDPIGHRQDPKPHRPSPPGRSSRKRGTHMTDDRHLRGLEARLSAVPPIHQVSAELRRVCLAAAFADDRPAARRSRRPFRPRMWSAVAAAGVAVGACVAIVHLPAERPRHAVQRVVHLRNSGTAVGVVRIGPPVGATTRSSSRSPTSRRPARAGTTTCGSRRRRGRRGRVPSTRRPWDPRGSDSRPRRRPG
jgi:hypothetical protein